MPSARSQGAQLLLQLRANLGVAGLGGACLLLVRVGLRAPLTPLSRRRREAQKRLSEGRGGGILATRGEQGVAEVPQDDGIARRKPRGAAQLGQRRLDAPLFEQAEPQGVRDGAVIGT